jgi:1A family penicillin-binding protein
MKKLVKLSVYFFVPFLFFVFVGGIFIAKWINSLPLPDFQGFEQRKIIQSTKIYDRTGKNLLYDIHQNIQRTIIPFEEMPRHIKNATVAVEDSEFYEHKGIKLEAIFRAFLTNLIAGKVEQGGSTITQQLVKNTFLTPEKSLKRKLKELVLALKMEKFYSKDEILALYLNEIPYGGSTYGIEAASQNYFGKPAKDLTLAESAYLAALPKAPTYYSPYGNHREELEERKNLVLKRMLDLGFINRSEYDSAKNETVRFLNPKEKIIQAPHFVFFVKSYLEQKYGEELVEQGGLRVTTTLDLELQKETEELAKQYAKEIEKKFNAYNLGVVGLDPKTGQILIMLGSRDWFGEPLPKGCQPGIDCAFEPKLNVVNYKNGRQPGSSFKPFVYATAFKKGYTPETVVFDLKTEFNSSCNPDGTPKEGVKPEECYQPQNYDKVFRGPVTFREALAQSINVPSVKVLYLAGLKDSLQTAKDLGITTLSGSSQYGLTLVLGGGEVTLLEMTEAYSVFANNGIRHSPTAILKIEDSQGNVLEEYKNQPKQVLNSRLAGLINDILSDNQARAPAFGEYSPLYFPDREVAVKTGTTNDYRDMWVIGYTPNFTLGLWVGNNDNRPMEKKVAGFVAAPLWHKIFQKVFEKIPKNDFPKPETATSTIDKNSLKPSLRGIWQGGISYTIDKISKKLASKFTPKDLREEKILVQVHNILYWVDKNNPLGSAPEDPTKDPQFLLWEKPVRDWVKKQKIKEETIDDIPKEYDDVHKPEYEPIIEIISPKENESFKFSKKIKISFREKSHFPIASIDFYLEGVYLGSLEPPPSEFIFKTERKNFREGKNVLKLIVYDQVKNKKEYTIDIYLK